MNKRPHFSRLYAECSVMQSYVFLFLDSNSDKSPFVIECQQNVVVLCCKCVQIFVSGSLSF